jgi:hypothetical protein
MPDALPTEVITANLYWSDTRDTESDQLLPPFGESLNSAYQSTVDQAGTRALLAVGIRELVPDGDNPEDSDASLESSARAFVQHLDDACGPSDHGLALATRYVAYTRGATFASQGDLARAISLVSSRDFVAELITWRPECLQSTEVLAQDYRKAHAPRQSCEAELIAAIGPYIIPYAVGSVIPALSRYLSHGRVIRGRISALSASNLARALLEFQATYAVEFLDFRTDARSASSNATLAGCVFGNVDHFLEYLFGQTMVNDGLASALAASVRNADDDALDFDARPLLRPTLPLRLSEARAAMHCFLPDKPSAADLLAAKAALVGSSAPPAHLLVIGGDATERRDLFRTLASAVGLRIVTASVSGLAELGDRTTQLASIISSAGHSAPSDASAAGVILIIEGLEALHVESMPDLSSYAARVVIDTVAEGTAVDCVLPGRGHTGVDALEVGRSGGRTHS